MTGPDDTNSRALFESAELLELLEALERSGLPLNESGEKIATISVDADVPERWRGRRTGSVALEGDATPRKIESCAIARRDYLDVVRIFGFGLIFKWAGGGDHIQGGIVLKNTNKPVDETGLDSGFITLHVDDVSKAVQPGSDLRHSIGSALMLG